MAKPTGRPVREEVLAAASLQIQRVGVNGFSYGDLAEELGIAAPSIHHHFRTKDDLVAAVSARYRAEFATLTAAIDAPSCAQRIGRFAELFEATADSDLHCLCGAMAGDWATIGERSRVEVAGFFDDQASWIRAQISGGVRSGELRADLDVDAVVDTLLAALEGSMLMARVGHRRALSTTIAAAVIGLATADG
jgi:TetR/AcrR family transcriptional repressor of nem operon